MPLAATEALEKAECVISALILFVAFGLAYKSWARSRRAGRPFPLHLETTAKERSLMVLAGTVAAFGSLPVMALAQHLMPRRSGGAAAIVTIYLLLAAWGVVFFFAKRQKTE